MDETMIRPCGDAALLVKFEQKIEPDILAAVTHLHHRIKAAQIPGIRDLIPAYATLMVCFDPSVTTFARIKKQILELADAGPQEKLQAGREIILPVLYGRPFPEDLAYVAKHAGISEEEVIRLHTERVYPVYMLGFLPGFPYLGNLNEKIHTPRRKEPRTAIPAGSVGIGGAQTGVYPISSPGGWHIIGSTPVKLYDPHSEQPVLLESGDLIRFAAIDEKTYHEIEHAGGRLCI